MSQDVGPPQGGPPSHDPRKSPSAQATDGSPAETTAAATPVPPPSTAGTLETAPPPPGPPPPPVSEGEKNFRARGDASRVGPGGGEGGGEVGRAPRPSPHHCG